jgi:hypothetical protein
MFCLLISWFVMRRCLLKLLTRSRRFEVASGSSLRCARALMRLQFGEQKRYERLGLWYTVFNVPQISHVYVILGLRKGLPRRFAPWAGAAGKLPCPRFA